MNENRSEISQLGEFGLIDRINAQFTPGNETSLKGIGDDAAVIDIGEEYLLVSTDMLVEGIHFDLSYVPIQHLGYKAVAVNVSDIAAMNGKAEQITVSIAISNRFSVEAIDALYAGIKAACESYKVDLVGGDTTSSASGLIISITAIGRVKKHKVVYRSGARVNDILCVTGDLGAAFLGLQVLEREKAVFIEDPSMEPGLENYEYLVGRQLKPDGRTDIIFDLATRLGLGEHFWGGDVQAAYRHQLAPSGLSLEALQAEPRGIRVPLATRHAKHIEPDAAGSPRGFPTPSHKVEFWSETLQAGGYAPMPEFVAPPAAAAERYPLVLTCAKSALFCQTQHRALPGLRRRAPVPEVMLHPETAARRGIAAGDWVSVETPAGGMRARALLNADIDPRVVVGEHGWWQATPEAGAPGYDPFSP